MPISISHGAQTGGGTQESGVRQLFVSENHFFPPQSEVGGTVLDSIESGGPEGVLPVPEDRRVGGSLPAPEGWRAEAHFLSRGAGRLVGPLPGPNGRRQLRSKLGS